MRIEQGFGRLNDQRELDARQQRQLLNAVESRSRNRNSGFRVAGRGMTVRAFQGIHLYDDGDLSGGGHGPGCCAGGGRRRRQLLRTRPAIFRRSHRGGTSGLAWRSRRCAVQTMPVPTMVGQTMAGQTMPVAATVGRRGVRRSTSVAMPSPAVRRRPSAARYLVQVMEGVLERAVKYAATQMNRRLQAVSPGCPPVEWRGPRAWSSGSMAMVSSSTLEVPAALRQTMSLDATRTNMPTTAPHSSRRSLRSAKANSGPAGKQRSEADTALKLIGAQDPSERSAWWSRLDRRSNAAVAGLPPVWRLRMSALVMRRRLPSLRPGWWYARRWWGATEAEPC